VLSGVEQWQSATRHAERIVAALAEPQIIAEHDLRVRVSIDVSIFPDDGEDAETLIKCADTAMYRAKENGRNNYHLFKPEMNQAQEVPPTTWRRRAARDRIPS
jgi:diguanylate cyclase (GGDEF)-like protein